MNQVTQLLSGIEGGDPHAASQLLPLVYDELRRLATHRLAQESPGQTLQPTALVHEAYLRLLGADREAHCYACDTFFGPAAQARRRTLVETVRRRQTLKRGGGLGRDELDKAQLRAPEPSEDLFALEEPLPQLADTDRTAADLV